MLVKVFEAQAAFELYERIKPALEYLPCSTPPAKEFVPRSVGERQLYLRTAVFAEETVFFTCVVPVCFFKIDTLE
mgnify:CR=1 FL=1